MCLAPGQMRHASQLPYPRSLPSVTLCQAVVSASFLLLTSIPHIQVAYTLSNTFLTALFDMKLRSRIVLHEDW